MKVMNLNRLGLILALAFPLGSAFGQNDPVAVAASPATAATNVNSTVAVPANLAEVVKLSKAGLGDDVVLAYVKSSRSLYHLKADNILQLKDAGVSASVITAMLNHDSVMLEQSRAQVPGQYPPPVNQPGPGPPMPPPGADSTNPPPPQAPVDAPLVDSGNGQSPPLQSEVIPVSPGADYYWAPGYWGWNGGWIWIGGGWYPHGYYGWGYRGGWGGWGGYRGGGFRGGGGGFWGHGGGGGGHGGGGHR